MLTGLPPGTKPAMRDAARVGDHLFVLPAGEAFDGRTLDVYVATTGR